MTHEPITLAWSGVGDVIARLARVAPLHTAIIDAERDVCHTTIQVDTRRRRLANALLGQLDPGDRVGVLMPNRAEGAESIYGITAAGMVQVNVNDSLTPAEMGYVLENSGTRFVIVDASLVDTLAAADSGMESVVVDGPGSPFEEMLDAASEREPQITVELDSPAVIIYTSGTTGRPKGVTLSHRNVLEGATNYLIECFAPDSAVYLASVPHYHVACVTNMGALMRGMTVVVCRFQAERVAALVEQYRVTHVPLPPAAVAMLLDVVESGTHDLSSLRRIIYGGAPMPEAVLRRGTALLGPIFEQTYGMTETSAVIAVLGAHDHDLNSSERLTSCGRPITRVDLAVVDPDGQPLPDNTPGELVARGANVNIGYWNDPQATAQSRFGDWFRTGDMAVRDADGFYSIVGRIKDMILSGGNNVYPIEVEKILQDHPGITEVAVIGTPHEIWGETVTAVVVGDPQIDIDALRAWCSDRLASYKQPRKLVHLHELPRNAIGKVDKPALQKTIQALSG